MKKIKLFNYNKLISISVLIISFFCKESSCYLQSIKKIVSTFFRENKLKLPGKKNISERDFKDLEENAKEAGDGKNNYLHGDFHINKILSNPEINHFNQYQIVRDYYNIKMQKDFLLGMRSKRNPLYKKCIAGGIGSLYAYNNTFEDFKNHLSSGYAIARKFYNNTDNIILGAHAVLTGLIVRRFSTASRFLLRMVSLKKI
jgi:hypothetical protein